MLIFLSSLLACQVMDSPGQVFSSVEVTSADSNMSESSEGRAKLADAELQKALDAYDEGPSDPLFQDPQEDVIKMGADDSTGVEPTASSPEVPVEEASGPTSIRSGSAQEVVAEPSVVAKPVPQPTSTLKPATVKDGWRPTLIGTLMDGPTPRAILALPSGEEKVIKAGDMLSDDGVVVMAIGTNFVELAIVQHAEGRAQIENLTLSAQF